MPYALARVTCEDTIRLGSNCWLGARVTVLKGVSIGHGSVVGAGAVVTESLPPFSMAVGFPAIVRKRYSFRNKRWIPQAEFCREDEESLPSEEVYAHTMQKKHGMALLPRHAAGNFWGDL
jgi:tetrahydrodipicolinate N-succinyltransferase